MAVWKIQNYYKKNAVERYFWEKNDITVFMDEGYRWGSWVCESAVKPDIDLDNPDGYELTVTDYEWDLESMDDVCWTDWQFPENMSDEERERIQNLWHEDTYKGMEDDGWVMDDSEQWIYGPIKLINEDTGEEFTGKEQNL